MEIVSLIMFDHVNQKLIPINDNIFQVSQFLGEKKLNEKYRGNLVLYPSGEVRVIKAVKVIGYCGQNMLSKIFSVLNKTNNISVSFEASTESIEHIAQIAFTYFLNDQSSNDPYLPKQNINELNFKRVGSFSELYSIINLPNGDDCLDIMV